MKVLEEGIAFSGVKKFAMVGHFCRWEFRVKVKWSNRVLYGTLDCLFACRVFIQVVEWKSGALERNELADNTLSRNQVRSDDRFDGVT